MELCCLYVFTFLLLLAYLSPIFQACCSCMYVYDMEYVEEAFILPSATQISETIMYLLEEVGYGSIEVCC